MTNRKLLTTTAILIMCCTTTQPATAAPKATTIGQGASTNNPAPMHQPLAGYTKAIGLFERLDSQHQPTYHSANSGLALLHEVNDFFNNSITYTSEANGSDYWQTPSETNTRRSGDCEDFAIAKWEALLQNGIPESSMTFYQGSARMGGEMHFVLRIRLDNNDYYLDNMSANITENPLKTNNLTIEFNRNGLTYHLVPTNAGHKGKGKHKHK